MSKKIDCLEDIAKEVSVLLNDIDDHDDAYDHTRWSLCDLEHYAEDAIIMLWTLNPQKFTTCKTIKLEKGRVQKLPQDCVKLTKVLGVNGDEAALSSIAATSDDRLDELFNDECVGRSSSSYSITNWSMEESSDNIFYVSPPVPFGEEVEIDVICSEVPDTSGDYCPERWMHNMIIEWMLYRAYSTEEESQYSQQNAQFHLQHFYSMVNNYIDAESNLMNLEQRGGQQNGPTSPSN